MTNRNLLNCVMLVDDDETTNFLHSIILEEAQVSENILTFDEAEDAVKYLSEVPVKGLTAPDLILLDINMPGMDGWEFIEAYKKIPDFSHDSTTLAMLTTSSNPDDVAKAESYQIVKGFLSKPLDANEIEKII